MELNLRYFPAMIMLLGLTIFAALVSSIAISGAGFILEPPSVQVHVSSAVMAAGYAGLGDGWGLQAVRKLIRFQDSSGIYALELPVMANSPPSTIAPVKFPEASPTAANGKAVLIYCTHTTESYLPDDKVNRTEGRPGLILEVARTLGSELAAQGYAVTVSEELHDWPDFTASYSHSRRTVEDYLQLYPNTVAIIDVHRDAFPEGGAVKTKVNGAAAAPVLLIVGTDQRKPHPQWRENLQLANRVKEKARTTFPGLVKGVRSKAGVYNQDLSTRAMLVEFGTDGNSLKEAKESATALAKVLAQVIGSDD